MITLFFQLFFLLTTNFCNGIYCLNKKYKFTIVQNKLFHFIVIQFDVSFYLNSLVFENHQLIIVIYCLIYFISLEIKTTTKISYF